MQTIKVAVDVDFTDDVKFGTVQVFRQIGNDSDPEIFECGTVQCRRLKTGALPADQRQREANTTVTNSTVTHKLERIDPN